MSVTHPSDVVTASPGTASPEEPVSQYVGSAVRRTEDRALLTGRGLYVDDIERPRLAHMSFVRSPHPHADIVAVDVAAARRIPGVLGIWTASDLPDIAACRSVPGMERPVLAVDRVRFVGEGVAVVVARDRYAAADAVRAVKVSYRPLPHVVSMTDALKEAAPVIVPGTESNIVLEQVMTATDASSEVQGSPHQLRWTIHNQRVAPLPMETIGCVAEWDQGGLTLWATTQAPHRLRNDLAEMLSTTQDKVRVVSPDVGGGFGAKACFYPEYLLAAVVARELGRPVKAVESRSESLVAMTHGRAQDIEVAVGFDRDGAIRGLSLRIDQDMGAWPEPVGVGLPALTTFMAQGCYKIPVIGVTTRCIATNTTPVSAYRGAGRPEASYMIERVMDRIARVLGLDPLELRRRNFIARDEQPYQTQFEGIIYEDADYPGCLDALLEHIDLSALRAEQAERLARSDDVLLGVGFSTWVEMGGFGPTASLEMFGYVGGWESAQIRVNPDASVVVAVGTSPHGQGHETAFAQIAADALGVEMSRVSVVHGDTRVVQEGIGTIGSRGMAVGGPAVLAAARQVRARMVEVAAHLLGCSIEDVSFVDGLFNAPGGEAKNLEEVVLAAYKPHQLPPDAPIGLEATCRYEPTNLSYPSGAHAAVVEVDQRTGLTRVRDYIAVDDCGVVINPLLARGQVEGGLAQGIAQALMEEVQYAEDGHPVCASLWDYPIPTAPDLPAYQSHHFVVPTSFNPLGAKGLGEAGTTAAPQAVVNAACDALAPLGVEDLSMPLTPSRVWQAIQTASGRPERGQPDLYGGTVATS